MVLTVTEVKGVWSGLPSPPSHLTGDYPPETRTVYVAVLPRPRTSGTTRTHLCLHVYVGVFRRVRTPQKTVTSDSLRCLSSLPLYLFFLPPPPYPVPAVVFGVSTFPTNVQSFSKFPLPPSDFLSSTPKETGTRLHHHIYSGSEILVSGTVENRYLVHSPPIAHNRSGP